MTAAPTQTSSTTLDLSSTSAVPLTRLVKVELRKMVDTRSGLWLIIAIALITAAITVIFMFAAEEDFGIAPIEAQAFGTPVIGFRKGGLVETVAGLEHDAPTGVLFDAQTPEAIAHAVQQFEAHRDRITSAACRSNAERFSAERFRREFGDYVNERYRAFAGRWST